MPIEPPGPVEKIMLVVGLSVILAIVIVGQWVSFHG